MDEEDSEFDSEFSAAALVSFSLFSALCFDDFLAGSPSWIFPFWVGKFSPPYASPSRGRLFVFEAIFYINNFTFIKSFWHNDVFVKFNNVAENNATVVVTEQQQHTRQLTPKQNKKRKILLTEHLAE
jgi:hypothetical protein